MKLLYKILFFVLFLSVLCGCNIISAGSYPNRETYKFNDISEQQLIESIQVLKKNMPEFEIPEELDFNDGFTDERKLWYSFYFHDNKEGIIYFFLVRKNTENGVDVSLVSVGKRMPGFEWLDINRDLKGNENDEYKLKFEETILNKLGLEYKKESFWDIFK